MKWEYAINLAIKNDKLVMISIPKSKRLEDHLWKKKMISYK